MGMIGRRGVVALAIGLGVDFAIQSLRKRRAKDPKQGQVKLKTCKLFACDQMNPSNTSLHPNTPNRCAQTPAEHAQAPAGGTGNAKPSNTFDQIPSIQADLFKDLRNPQCAAVLCRLEGRYQGTTRPGSVWDILFSILDNSLSCDKVDQDDLKFVVLICNTLAMHLL
jgi:hypothetical protein